MKTFKEQQEITAQEVHKAEQEASDSRAWFRFLQKHPEVSSCTANWEIIKEYYRGDPMTEENLEDSYLHIKNQLALQDHDDKRKAIEAEIMSLLGGSTEAKQSIASHFRYRSIDDLQTQLENLKQQKEMQSKSPDELRTIIKSNRLTVPEMPYYTRNQIRTMPAQQLKQLIQRYGSAQVNHCLNQGD